MQPSFFWCQMCDNTRCDMKKKCCVWRYLRFIFIFFTERRESILHGKQFNRIPLPDQTFWLRAYKHTVLFGKKRRVLEHYCRGNTIRYMLVFFIWKNLNIKSYLYRVNKFILSLKCLNYAFISKRYMQCSNWRGWICSHWVYIW